MQSLYLQEVMNGIVGFLTSLNPGNNYDPFIPLNGLIIHLLFCNIIAVRVGDSTAIQVRFIRLNRP